MDKYRKLERIGKGSFGSAYLVEKRGEPGKQYVIKEIQIDPRDQKAAVREARLLAALDHPNIIACKEHFMLSPGQKILCIVTEYADGGDLRKLLKQYEAAGRRLDEDLVLDLLVQMCLALKHVHDRKILHRDVKPENIFLMQSHERHPAVRGYAAPTAAMRKRGEAMAAKKERVQALVAKQREQAEMRLIQEKKARLAHGDSVGAIGAGCSTSTSEVSAKGLWPTLTGLQYPTIILRSQVPQDAAFALQAKLEVCNAMKSYVHDELWQARRQQLLEQQAVRDLPMMVPVKESRDRDADRLKMAEDIKEKKRLLKDVHPNSNDPILLVQVLKSPHDNHALPVPPPVLAAPSVMIPKVEAIFAPDTITLNSTGTAMQRALPSSCDRWAVGSPKHAATPDSSLPLESQTDASDEETMSKADAPTNLAGDTDVQVDDIEATSRCNGKRSFEYERMVLHMKCVMEEELAEDPDDDDGDARTAEVDPADEVRKQVSGWQSYHAR
ncbi:hypothetical protein DYB32_001401 [Aphanomyces invadans]|uniref:non-specific serine/threonine protein kinase n=1 Tax=Aphanomyces invadans TaxID=157072 RepID=A0A418B6Q2_9STRA|nr:hypothetical protein DYB32_001401 [Aphanomyces invadans]